MPDTLDAPTLTGWPVASGQMFSVALVAAHT